MNAHADANDQALALRIKEGDARAWEKALAKHGRMIEAVAWGLLRGSTFEAAEIVSQVGQVLWDERERLEPAKGLKLFLCTVARNLSLNRLEMLDRHDPFAVVREVDDGVGASSGAPCEPVEVCEPAAREEDERVEPAPSAEEEFDEEMLDRLRLFGDALPPGEVEIAWLLWGRPALTRPQVAKKLGLQRSAVNVLVRKIRKTLEEAEAAFRAAPAC